MCSVVIVEDEELERFALRTILLENISGIQIVGEARTGPEAIRLIDRYSIDLMLVDINIPKINGLEVIKYLRGKGADTRVIITTAYDDFDMTHEAIKLKADDYLLKPIRPQLLVKTVQACLQNGMDQEQKERCREFAEQMGQHLENRSYRDAVSLVRSFTDWLFSNKEEMARRLTLDSADALAQMAERKELRAGGRIRQLAERLRPLRLCAEDRFELLNVFLKMTDIMFDEVGGRFGYSDNNMKKALNYIERNIRKGVTLEDVAEHVNISTYYLSKLFKKEMGVNFISYLTDRKIELAKELLLQTNQSIVQIALDLSYNDANYFCKSFKKKVGVPPSEYRERNRTGTGLEPVGRSRRRQAGQGME